MRNIRKQALFGRTAFATLATLVGVSVSACGSLADAGETSDQTVGAAKQGIVCGSESRSQITNLNYPRGSLGWLQSDLGSCTATIIAPRKIMTAQHCQGTAPGNVTFYPHANIPTAGFPEAGVHVVRWVLGRDLSDSEVYADWAIMTVDTDLSALLGSTYQTMNRVIPITSGGSVSDFGYPGQTPIMGGIDWTGKAVQQLNGTLTVGSDNILYSNLDIEGGHSGGPWFRINGQGTAELLGVTANGSSDAEGSSCSGLNGNHAASANMFAFAPDNAIGLATAINGDGRPRVFASDADWTLIAYRDKVTTASNGPWSPWNANDSAFSDGRKMTAVNLADNRQELWVITSSGALKTRWQSSVDGAFGGWATHSTPTTIKDIAATGGNGVTTHLFTLGTDNVVRVAYKTGGAGSGWSAWSSLGTVSGALSLSAHYFGGVHEVYVVSSAGAQTAWGSAASFTGLVGFGTSTGGFQTIGAGVLQDGRANVMAVNGSGALFHRIRGNDGNWTAWTAMSQGNPVNTTGFITLSPGRLIDGRQQMFGVGSDGNVYTIWEESGGTFNPTWIRFYK